MDKWDALTSRIARAAVAEEPEAALMGALQLFAEFGCTFELISGDMDRLVIVVEKLVEWEEITGSAE